MNHRNTVAPPGGLEALQARFGLRVAARLDDASGELPPDINERLKSARELALARAREARRVQAAAAHQAVADGGGILVLGRGPRSSWWVKLAALAPVLALAAGFMLIERFHRASQIQAAVEIDTAMLADGVPPAAYSDPGFVEFLRSPQN